MIIDSTDPKIVVFFILGGLAIFLFGITFMSDFLKKLAGPKLKIILEKTTNNPLKGVLTGIALTAVIQSSSATAAIVIGLASANLIDVKNAVAIVLGAKIGTTITSVFISFNLGVYAPLIIFIGVILFLFFKKKVIKNTGGAILGFGLLFFGLNLIGASLDVVANTTAFQNFLVSAGKHPILGLLVGTVATALIQSSSATIGILQEIYTSGTIPLVVAVSIVIGSNIGTTITSVIASVKSNSNGKKVAFIHVFVSIITSLIFFIFIVPYTNLLVRISNWFNINHLNSMVTISLSHILFNIITVFSSFWFLNQFVFLSDKIIKDKNGIIFKKVSLNNQLIKASPELALESVNHAIHEMGLITIKMFQNTEDYATTGNEKAKEQVFQCEERLNQLDIDIHNYLVRIGAEDLREKQMQKLAKNIDTVTDLERIGDHLDNLIEFFTVRHDNKIVLSDVVEEEITSYTDLIKEQLINAVKAYYTFDKKLADEIIKKEYEINALFKEYRSNNTLRISQDLEDNHFNHYVDIISNLERIGDHCYNIAENVKYEDFMYTKKAVRA